MTEINRTTSQMNGHLIKGFAQLVSLSWKKNKSPSANTRAIQNTIKKFVPHFCDGTQQDALEFLQFFLVSLHEDINTNLDERVRFPELPFYLK